MKDHPIRKSLRIKEYDYSLPGAYFITICTKNRNPILAINNNGNLTMTHEGIIVNKYWFEIQNHFPHLTLDAFIIMPDHIHSIIIINEHPVGSPDPGDREISDSIFHRSTLGNILNRLKRACTIEIRKHNAEFARQSRYYEHIIHNEKDLQRIRKYIFDNL